MFFKIFYLTYYMFVAATTYLNIHFKNIGLSTTQIGLMTSISTGINIIILPLWGIIADYLGANKKTLLLALAGAVGILLSFLNTNSFLIIFFLYIFYKILRGPLVPLSDSLLLNHLGQNSNKYGKFRVWGAVGYMLVVTPFGFFIEKAGSTLVFIIAASTLLLAFLTGIKLPKSRKKVKLTHLNDFKILFKKKKLFHFLIFCIFIQIPLTVYFVYFPIYVKDYGGSETLIGIAMLITSASELMIFQNSDLFLSKFKLKTLLIISSFAYTIRWLLLGLFPAPSVFLFIQIFQGISYGLFHVTAVFYAAEMAGEDFQATAQNLYASTLGIATVISSLAGGLVYDHLGGQVMFLTGGCISFIAGIIYYYHLSKKENLI